MHIAPPSDAPPSDAIEWAIAAATQSGCQKSRRGVAIFGVDTHEIIANGTNHRPAGGLCSGSDDCKATCRFICVHAEVHAIRRALVVQRGGAERRRLSRDLHHLHGHDAVHVKIDARQQLVAGGGPSCLSCAREVLDIGLAGFWLYESGPEECPGPLCVGGPECELPSFPKWLRYTAEEFFRLSLLHDRDVPR